jgi:hypothetical protein
MDILALALSHYMPSLIQEIFIPEKDIGTNFGDGELHVFKTNAERYKDAEKIGEVEMEEKDVDSVLSYLNF